MAKKPTTKKAVKKVAAKKATKKVVAKKAPAKKKVSVRAKVKTNSLLFDTYKVREGETPEMIADKLYDDPELHWVILLINDISLPSTSS